MTETFVVGAEWALDPRRVHGGPSGFWLRSLRARIFCILVHRLVGEHATTETKMSRGKAGRCWKFRPDGPKANSRCGIFKSRHPSGPCPDKEARRPHMDRAGTKRNIHRRSTSYTPEEVAVQLAVVEAVAKGGDLKIVSRSKAYQSWARKVLVMAGKIPPKRTAPVPKFDWDRPPNAIDPTLLRCRRCGLTATLLGHGLCTRCRPENEPPPPREPAPPVDRAILAEVEQADASLREVRPAADGGEP